jgi:hypothetical protein
MGRRARHLRRDNRTCRFAREEELTETARDTGSSAGIWSSGEEQIEESL